MFTWIAANMGTILISAALAAVVACIIAAMVRDRKKGKSPCGCDCGHCPMDGSCHNH